MTPTSALVPAGARADTFSDVEAVLNQEAIELFATAVGGRDRLADTLAVAGSGTEIERITTLLLDPRYRAWSLSRICQMTGITVADLFASYRKALFTRAHIEASHIIASKLPPVVDDVMDKATPAPMLCPLCHGSRVVDTIEPEQAPVPCTLCAGTGTVLSEPTVERHKLALELGQLLEKKGGLIVQQNNLAATVGATAPGSLEQLQQAVGDLLFGERRPYDPRVIVPAPDPPARPDEGDEEPSEDDDPGGEQQPDLPFEQPDSPLRQPDRADPPTRPTVEP